LLLARSGAKVLVVDIERRAAEETVAMIEAEGGAARPFVADVADERQCRALVEAAVSAFGRLDLLDNNVGIGWRGSVVDTLSSCGAASCRLMSTACSTSRGMRSRRWSRRRAAVPCIAISALRPGGLTAYSTSKRAVIALTRAMESTSAIRRVRALADRAGRRGTRQEVTNSCPMPSTGWPVSCTTRSLFVLLPVAE